MGYAGGGGGAMGAVVETDGGRRPDEVNVKIYFGGIKGAAGTGIRQAG